MIQGVLAMPLKTFHDERGYFRDGIRNTYSTGVVFKQINFGERNQGVSNGWHIHEHLSEWFVIITGSVRLALKDCRSGVARLDQDGTFHADGIPVLTKFVYRTGEQDFRVYFGKSMTTGEYNEIDLGEHYHAYSGISHNEVIAVFIPHGTAHAYKVLEGPCHMVYVASELYDPNDEGRIEYDRWPDHQWWRDVEIK